MAKRQQSDRPKRRGERNPDQLVRKRGESDNLHQPGVTIEEKNDE